MIPPEVIYEESGWRAVRLGEEWLALTHENGLSVRARYSQKRGGHPDLLHVEVTAGDKPLSGRTFREIPFAQVEQSLAGPPAGPSSAPPPLEATRGGDLTDVFLRGVAEHYQWAVRRGQPPAPVIASQTQRPVATVHRWIYQARMRGHLPPARRGREG